MWRIRFVNALHGSNLRAFAWLLAVTLFIVRPVLADLCTFVAGGSVELPAEYEGDQVRLLAPDRVYTFLKSDFQEITARSSAIEEWPEREQAAGRGDVFDRLEAARWAWTHGLTRQAETLIRVPGARLPQADSRLGRLRDRLDALETPWEEPNAEALTGDLGGKFLVARGPHVLLLHQHSESEAAERVELLEQVIRAFFLEFEDAGISLPNPKFQLVSVWYRYHRPYLNYLERQGARAFQTTRGFHHVARGIVVSYDARSDADQVLGRDRLDQDELKLKVLQAAGSPGDSELEAKLRDIERQRLLFDLRWRELDLGTAAHETIHQLVAQTGLAPSYPAFPVWLHEGLAMQYEPVVGGRWVGSANATSLRLRDYRAMPQPPALADLLADKGLGQGYRREPYADSWAWVHYLRTAHPRIWVTLLDQLRGPEAGAESACQRASSVILSRGPANLKLWERQWHERTSAFWKPTKPAGKAPVSTGNGRTAVKAAPGPALQE